MLLYRDDLYKIHSIFKRLAEKHKKVDEPIASPIIETETFVFDDWDDFINHSH